MHAIFGEGNFVLVVAEGKFGDHVSAYYDLYRIHGGKIAEHWDAIEALPPRADWKNSNGRLGLVSSSSAANPQSIDT